MAFCEKCGAALEDGAKICPNCGAGREEAQKAEAPAAKPVENEDVKANKGAAIVSYIFPLTLVTMFATKGSKFARFHLDQSLFCYILYLAGSFAIKLLSNIFVYGFNMISGGAAIAVNTVFQIINWLWLAFVVVLLVIGIVFAAQGKTEELFLYKAFRALKAKLAAVKDDPNGVPVSEDMKERIICALAYIPPFFFLPLIFFRKDNKFARFHANQALIFNIAVIVILGVMLGIECIWNFVPFTSRILMSIVGIITSLIYNVIFFAAQMAVVLGFMNAGFGRTKAVGFLKNVKIFK
ncbi:MAG: zinc ribbon domain-containing protein [Clostridia bacterium]|nr:zinc ribbon domain-containing protein [Clostridia bacterium]